MEIPTMHKRTEAGLLPADWDVKPLGDVVEFLDGMRRPVKKSVREQMKGKYPYYGASGIVDYVNDYLFDEDLVLLGEDGENILSRNRRLAFEVSGKLWVNNHAHVIRPGSDVHITYLAECLESLDYSEYNTGTAQPKLTKKTCSAIPIPLPGYEEQRAIAEVLSDVDALIEQLDALIAKKRAVKTATMQRLLTGKQRLPGFSEPWETRRLGEVTKIVNGGTPSSSVDVYWNGDIPWCTPTDITGTSGRYLSETERNITEKGLANSSASLLPEGTLLLCSRATVGEVKIAVTPITTNQGFKSLICGPDVSNEFLYYILLTMKSELEELSSGSTFLELSKRSAALLEITLPPIQEQKAIAQILSDMDAEIEALEARRGKTQRLKQGMMQELLTGRTRLV